MLVVVGKNSIKLTVQIMVSLEFLLGFFLQKLGAGFKDHEHVPQLIQRKMLSISASRKCSKKHPFIQLISFLLLSYVANTKDSLKMLSKEEGSSVFFPVPSPPLLFPLL